MSTPTTLRERLGYLLRTSDGAQANPEIDLHRSLSTMAVLLLAVGSVIGTGIFVILGVVVPLAGPAVVLSFILAGVACLMSGLSYAELASTLPSSGSVYSYAYASVGEFAAWVVGWCLILEYGVGVAAVSVGWSEYLNEGLQQAFGFQIPAELSNSPASGGIVNLPAAFLVLSMAAVVSFGVKESARINAVLVVVKLALIVLFLVITFTGFESSNLTPFAPLGAAGVLAAAGKLIFAYAGFDAAAVAGAESKNPKRAVPIAIVGALTLITVIYTLVALAAVAAKPWQEFEGDGGEAALARIVQEVSGWAWTSEIISVGAIIAIISVVLALLYTLSRVIYTMSRDGLLPKKLGTLSPRRHTPVFSTWVLAGFLALLAALVPLVDLAAAISLGTLVAFGVVNVAVIVLRRTRPELKREFRVPLGPTIPIVAILLNLVLMVTMPHATWIAFSIWLVAGIVIYFTYSRHRSHARIGG
ncbi:MAG: amino acid permease [Candidatus Nanopelagicales bacterium]